MFQELFDYSLKTHLTLRYIAKKYIQYITTHLHLPPILKKIIVKLHNAYAHVVATLLFLKRFANIRILLSIGCDKATITVILHYVYK